MSYWNIGNPIKPWGLFDPNAELNFSLDWSLWLADIAAGYESHEIICQTGLTCPEDSESGGVITFRIKKDPAQTLVAGRQYSVTVRITADDGQIDDRSVYLKITER